MRRTIYGVLVAAAIAVAVAGLSGVSLCDGLDPGGFWFWFWGCEGPAGGGSSGAGLP